MEVGYARWFAELGAGEAGSAGGKGASLGELTRAGVPVPPGFVVTTDAFEEAIAGLDPAGEHRERIARLDPDDLDAVARVTGELRHQIERAPLPDRLRDAVLARYRALDAAPVAVRSSATSEDGAEASFAGLQDTYLWVRGEDSVLAHLCRCWASLYRVESVSYRRHRKLPEGGLAMAVVVQRMVDPDCAGVMFTRSPVTGDRSVVAVEAAWGLGSALVSGDVTPDQFMVSKVTGEVSSRKVACKLRRHTLDPAGAGVSEQDVPADLQQAPCLTESQLAALVGIAKRIEEHYRAPQDIEWALAGDEVFVLQSRPETVWAQRDAAPVAPSRPRALDHVLDALSGQATRARTAARGDRSPQGPGDTARARTAACEDRSPRSGGPEWR